MCRKVCIANTLARACVTCPADGKYDAIVAAFETKKRGAYARIMVVNPLHCRLPKICIMIQVSTQSSTV